MLSVMDKNANAMTEDLNMSDSEGTNVQETLLSDEVTNSADAVEAIDGDADENQAPERQTWGKKIDFLLSVIGFAVDLANVWRFPYLCYKNGGGAFLIPYLIMLVMGGIPLFYMELALGQYFQKGAISTWGTICPIFKGIGWAVILIAFFTDFFYNVIISWALYYLFASFNKVLPWTTCGEWSTESCFSGHTKGEKYPQCMYVERVPICKRYEEFLEYRSCLESEGGDNCTVVNFNYPTISHSEMMLSFPNSVIGQVANESFTYASKINQLSEDDMSQYCEWKPNVTTSPATEYFQRGVLGIHESKGIGDIGSLRWQNVLCLLAIYLICYFSLFKGISTSGKVVWFTAIFPYIVLFILLIRGLTLEGATVGITQYITPNFANTTNPTVWVDAATQVFFSLGPGFGVLLAFSSYNKFNNNVYRDAIMTSIINSATSFLAGFVVFSFLGYLSVKTCKDFYEVAQEGPGLVFEIYPEAIATLPGSTFWSILFFTMLLTLGLDSSFGGSEAIITGLTDEFKCLKNRREIFVGVLFLVYFLIGLASCAQGGMYVVRMFEVSAAGYSILFAVFCESVIVSWIYGGFKFSFNIKEMIGSSPGPFWLACWMLIAPIFLGIIMISGLTSYEPITYQDYDYPDWAVGFGWFIAGISMACIPFGMLIMTCIHKGDFKKLFNGWWSDPESYSSMLLADYKEFFSKKPKIPIVEATHATGNGEANVQDTSLIDDKKSTAEIV